jgi:hypothetical protein
LRNCVDTSRFSRRTEKYRPLPPVAVKGGEQRTEFDHVAALGLLPAKLSEPSGLRNPADARARQPDGIQNDD